MNTFGVFGDGVGDGYGVIVGLLSGCWLSKLKLLLLLLLLDSGSFYFIIIIINILL